MTLKDYGWQPLASVETQEWTDEHGNVEYGCVWLITREGTLFGRSIRKNETLKEVCNYYKLRGFTDELCDYFKELQRAIKG